MIADKIIPSFYIVEVEGQAVGSIISGDFGIEKIVFGSTDFDTDMHATAALQQVLEYIALAPHLDLGAMTETVDFNPEFFPSLTPIKLTEEQKEQLEGAADMADEMAKQLASQNKIAINLTKVFDNLGDFVQSRWTVQSPELKIIGKIAVNPDEYIQQKARDQALRMTTLLAVPNITMIH